MKRIFLILIFLFSSAFYDIEEKQNIAPEPASGFVEKVGVASKEFMVVAAHPLAVEAGYKIIRKGGNAVDAAIAVQMVLSVVEPHASGIGGGGFLLFHEAGSRDNYFYDGRETAPKTINPKVFLDKTGFPQDFFDAVKGGLSVGTPGVLAMLKKAHEEHGKLAWFELFEDAINIAVNGFPYSERLHEVADHTKHIREFVNVVDFYLNQDGTAKERGTLIKNPEIANVYREIAQNGIKDFYEGEIAKAIVDKVQNSTINPGYLSLDDLSDYKVYSEDLICSKYRKYKVCGATMPSSGGVAVLQALGILENFDLSQLEPDSSEAIHIIAEAMRFAYADRNKYAADDKYVKVPYEEMLDKKYLKERSFQINVDSTLLKIEAGEFKTSSNFGEYVKPIEPPSTSHISIVDKEGNAVSFTTSIEYSFGSGLMVKGFLLNNQLTDFSFVPEIEGKPVANRVEPGKKPRSSMAPIFVFDKNDNLVLVVGSPGGARIISYVLKTIVAVLDWGLNVNDAVALPNFVKMNDYLELEKGSLLEAYKEEFEEKGHLVQIKDLTSGIHAIQIKDNVLYGGVDTRREGIALGD